jgi:hypothetical protein
MKSFGPVALCTGGLLFQSVTVIFSAVTSQENIAWLPTVQPQVRKKEREIEHNPIGEIEDEKFWTSCCTHRQATTQSVTVKNVSVTYRGKIVWRLIYLIQNEPSTITKFENNAIIAGLA